MKGFTLIELLAVIVILSIVILISVSIVSNTIEESKKKSFINSTLGILESAKLNQMENKLKGEERDYVFTYSSGVESPDVLGQKLNYSGKKPESGKVFSYSNGTVAMALFFDGYCTIKFKNDSDVLIEKISEADCGEYIAVLNYPKPTIKTIPESDFDIMTNIAFSIEELVTDEGFTVIDTEWQNVQTNYVVGEHTVRVRAKFSNDFWGPWASFKINVEDLTPPVANITMSPTEISNVTNVTLDHTASTTYNRTTIANQEWQNKLTNYPVGNHTVRLRVQDSNGLWSPWTEINFNVTQFITETVTYDYISNAVRTYTVVNGGVYRLETFGAQGGTGGRYCDNSWGGACYNGTAGTTGATARGEVRLEAGDILYIYIGEQGKNGANYTNETGSAGCHQYGWAGGGGGGGGSVVRLNTDDSSTRIIGSNGGTGGNAQGSTGGCTYAASGLGGYSVTSYNGTAGYRQTGGAGGGAIYTTSLLNVATTATGRTGHGRFILTRTGE